MATQADVEKMKLSTIAQAYDLPYRQAATEKLRRETELLGREGFETFTDDYGRTLKRNLQTGEVTQVTAEPRAPVQTQEEKERLKRIPTDIARGDYWRDPKTEDIQWVAYGDKPPAGYTQRVPSREVQVSDLPGKRFEFTKEKAVMDSAAKIRMNLKKPAVKPLIDFVNQNSIGTTGFIWLEEAKTFWPDKKETVEVKLPKNAEGKQLMMTDIRRVAKINNVSVEEVLRQVYDSM